MAHQTSAAGDRADERVVPDPGTNYVLSQVGGDVHVAMGGGELILAGVQLSSLTSGWISALPEAWPLALAGRRHGERCCRQTLRFSDKAVGAGGF